MWKAFGNWIKNLFSGVEPGLVTGLGGLLAGQVFGLTRAEKQQNKFNAEQAQMNRDFQLSAMRENNQFAADQAQAQMDFQERMANTEWQRGVKDMQAAGLNPALAYGQGGASAMSGAAAAASGTPSGSAASGSGRGAIGSLSDIMQLAMMKKQLRAMDDEHNERVAGLQAQTIENAIKETYGPARAEAEIRQIEQAIQESLARAGENATRSALNAVSADLARVQMNNQSLETAEKEWRKKFIEEWHMSPEVAGELVKAAATLVGAGALSVSRLIDVLKKPKGTIRRITKVPAGKVIVEKPLN